MNELSQNLMFIGTGIQLTLGLLLGGLAIGIVSGTLIAVLRYNNIAGYITNPFVSVIRGTPLILQLSFVYFAIPGLLGFKPGILVAGIITFGLNSAAYISEILRSGIESLPKGQFEAASTLNIPTWYLWKDIILPQVLKNIFPALVNEVIALLKETALISTIGGMDVMRKSQSIAAEQFTYFLPLCIAGCYYYAFVLLVEYCGKRIEKGEYFVNHS